MLNGFTIQNFRNFGSDEQWVAPLRRVNVLIGTNNSGKSNILRYLKRVVSPAADPSRTNAIEQHEIDRPRTGDTLSTISIWEPFPPNILPQGQKWRPEWTDAFAEASLLDASKRFLKISLPIAALQRGEWYSGTAPQVSHQAKQAFYQIWQIITPQSQGSFEHHWFKEVYNRFITASLRKFDAYYIPSFRQIPSRMTDFQDEFAAASDGQHIIDQLADLAYPSYREQGKKREFERLRGFVGSIIGDPEVQIEIPNDRQTINVSTKGSFLPIESLGSGVHEVFMLASQIIVRPNQTMLLEEPEAHLHPTLQRRFMKFVMEETKNQIFITTHSATIIDTPGAQVFEVRNEKTAVVWPITTSQERFAACRELGFKASDLVQSNSIIWVEGPSDRIYLLSWLGQRARHLVEGVHFSIMFYGGKLLSHLSVEDETVDDFIQLLPICRKPAILIDSDKSGGNSALRETKVRIQNEFASLNAFCWITDGREIENYYSVDDRTLAVSDAHENVAGLTGGPSRYDKPISFRRVGDPSERVADKIAVANYLTKNAEVSVTAGEFDLKIRSLVEHISNANA